MSTSNHQPQYLEIRNGLSHTENVSYRIIDDGDISTKSSSPMEHVNNYHYNNHNRHSQFQPHHNNNHHHHHQQQQQHNYINHSNYPSHHQQQQQHNNNRHHQIQQQQQPQQQRSVDNSYYDEQFQKNQYSSNSLIQIISFPPKNLSNIQQMKPEPNSIDTFDNHNSNINERNGNYLIRTNSNYSNGIHNNNNNNTNNNNCYSYDMSYHQQRSLPPQSQSPTISSYSQEINNRSENKSKWAKDEFLSNFRRQELESILHQFSKVQITHKEVEEFKGIVHNEKVKRMPMTECRVENVVTAFNLDTKISLYDLTMNAANIEYARDKARCTIRWRDPKATMAVFASGSATCTGCVSEESAFKASRRIAKYIYRIGKKRNLFSARFTKYRIVNVLGVAQVPWSSSVDLKLLLKFYPQEVSYEPMIHSGAKMTIPIGKDKVVIKVYHSGAMSLMGKRMSVIEQGLAIALHKLARASDPYSVLYAIKRQEFLDCYKGLRSHLLNYRHFTMDCLYSLRNNQPEYERASGDVEFPDVRRGNSEHSLNNLNNQYVLDGFVVADFAEDEQYPHVSSNRSLTKSSPSPQNDNGSHYHSNNSYHQTTQNNVQQQNNRIKRNISRRYARYDEHVSQQSSSNPSVNHSLSVDATNSSMHRDGNNIENNQQDHYDIPINNGIRSVPDYNGNRLISRARNRNFQLSQNGNNNNNNNNNNAISGNNQSNYSSRYNMNGTNQNDSNHQQPQYISHGNNYNNNSNTSYHVVSSYTDDSYRNNYQ
ncbi:hypothetical protein SNEBB_007268 [Seison nebaliae]|nr:hypothetical protein SNEBB_007268 [Seison nebaliae]